MNYSEIPIQFLYPKDTFSHFIRNTTTSYISVLVSVSVDMKNIGILSVLVYKKIEFIGLYRYWEIRKKAYQSPTAYTTVTFLK